MAQCTASTKMQVFIVVWLGQLVSLVGSGLTSFALGIWVYQRTGSVTQFALISLFATLPSILISPLAGALVDRWEQRWSMIFSDLGAGVSTLAIALLLLADQLQVWHIYLAIAAISTFNAFQRPAYTAATTLLVPKQHLGRASGLVQIGLANAQIIAPLIAGVLVVKIRLQGVILIDFITYIFALMTLLLARFPPPNRVKYAAKKKSLLNGIAYGWTYITAQPGLLGLLLLLAISNFLLGIVEVLVTPLVLSIASPAALGTVISGGGIGMLLGSLVMSAWGGPKRRIRGVLDFTLLGGACVLLCGLQPSTSLITIAVFSFFFGLPIVNGCCQTIMQTKVAPEVQGRVFAIHGMLVMSTLPLAYLIAGPLADRVFEPLLVADGLLAGSVGQIIGVGPGRGIGLLFVVSGILNMLITAGGYLYPRLRLVEDEVPDA